jgi:putative hydrolase
VRASKKPRFFRFSELTAANISRDFQIHTRWTDGEGEIEEVLEKAIQRGLSEIAFTEHARHTSDYYSAFFSEIDEQSTKLDTLEVFRGFEVKLLDFAGNLDISDDMRDCADIVLASVHGLPRPNADPAPARDFSEADANTIEFEATMGFLHQGVADVLSHAGGMSLRTFGRFPISCFDEIIAEAAKTSIAFEINSSYHTATLEDLLVLLQKYDPLVSLGSDVHKVSSLGDCRDKVKRALGL